MSLWILACPDPLLDASPEAASLTSLCARQSRGPIWTVQLRTGPRSFFLRPALGWQPIHCQQTSGSETLLDQRCDKQDHTDQAESEDPRNGDFARYVLFRFVVLIINHDDGLTVTKAPGSMPMYRDPCPQTVRILTNAAISCRAPHPVRLVPLAEVRDLSYVWGNPRLPRRHSAPEF